MATLWADVDFMNIVDDEDNEDGEDGVTSCGGD